MTLYRKSIASAATVLLLAASLASAEDQSDAGPRRRRIILAGGPTLKAWGEVSPDFFKNEAVHLVIAEDGSTRTMSRSLQAEASRHPFEVLQILPESGLAGETPAAAEADIVAMAEVARTRNAHVVLAAPIHFGSGEPSPEDRALQDWMKDRALSDGFLYTDYSGAKSSGPAPMPPLNAAADLLPRTALVRSALDAVFRIRPGLSQETAMKQLAELQSTLSDTPGTGPYPAIRAIDPALPSHTFYRPANLAPFTTDKLPVLIFGNGGCTDDSGHARLLLEEVASHGYLVIAPGFMKSGPGAFPRPARAGLAPPDAPLRTNLDDLKAALDWLSTDTESSRAWRAFIDPTKVAVAGWSCGGLQATALARDPRIGTAIIFDSGIFTSGNSGIPGLAIDKSDLAALHGPMLYVLGGVTDVAFENGSDDYRHIDKVPAVLISRDVGHSGTFWEPNGGAYAQAAVAWLDWRLRGRADLSGQFIGAKCGLCREGWSVQSKGF